MLMQMPAAAAAASRGKFGERSREVARTRTEVSAVRDERAKQARALQILCIPRRVDAFLAPPVPRRLFVCALKHARPFVIRRRCF